MKLIIVESPTKAKTISTFLGSGFQVLSSYGHIRDLPKSKLSIDVAHNFEPTYSIPPKAKEHVKDLLAAASKADSVILASDEDREGEAIAWHIAHVIKEGSKNKKGSRDDFQRIVFHEITKPAIEHALKHPRGIDMNLVNAQQARRVLDRLVGYELSPFLWRKIRYGLSAGRVQSVAVRLVVEREREIQQFVAQEYWTIEGLFSKDGSPDTFTATLHSMQGKTLSKMALSSETQTRDILSNLSGARYRVASVTKKELLRNPSPPFITSTLQQEAARTFGMSAKQTMVIAQQLYEHGHITYMRTDSTHVSRIAQEQAREIIGSLFGARYQLDTPRVYATKSKGAQEAHEAIRPTNILHTPDRISLSDSGQRRLYTLIWKRTVASQMQQARVEQTTADIATKDDQYVFRATGQVILFDGFIRVYTEGTDDESSESSATLPPLTQNDHIICASLKPLQHFTEPPARYTDATLIKALENAGVGRPSTYAPTLSTIQERGYVEKTDKKYHPTEIGIVVNDMLVQHFPEIVDINFTSHIEEELDAIAEGTHDWVSVCREFYEPFKKHLVAKEHSVQKSVEQSDIPCPHCGKLMIIKFGRFGRFLSCPEEGSKITKPLPEEEALIRSLEEKTKDEHCPLCKKTMTVKRGRFGFFLGCVDYPTCKGIAKIWNKTGFKCPLCSQTPQRSSDPGDIVEKKGCGRGKPFWACTRWPDCTLILNKKPTTQEELSALFEEWKIAQNKPKKKAGKKTTRKTKLSRYVKTLKKFPIENS